MFSRFRFHLSSWCLAAALGIAGAPARATDPSHQQQRANLLQIAAVAVDADGAPVTDLRKEDFEVWLAGHRLPIEMLAATLPEDRRGRELVLLLDDVTVAPGLVPRVKEAARHLVARMGPGDLMSVATLSGTVVPRTDDPARLRTAIDRYGVRARGVTPIVELGADFLRTVAALGARLVEVPGERKTIVGLGSAWLFDTPIPPPGAGRDLRAEWTDAMRALAHANAAFYVIDPGGVGTVPVGEGRDGFSRQTGGHAFVNTNDLQGAADRILREAASYYVIGVADPPVFRKAPLRELDVRARRPGVTIRARRGIPGQ